VRAAEIKETTMNTWLELATGTLQVAAAATTIVLTIFRAGRGRDRDDD
jgi:hypothetical protein